MQEMELRGLMQEWLKRKASNPQYEIADFIEEEYMKAHEAEPGSGEEKRKRLKAMQTQWEVRGQEYDEALGAYADDPSLAEWQAAEMLNNVMEVFAMPAAERYQYLLNVKYLVSCQLAAGQEAKEAEILREAFWETYQAASKKAMEAREAALQELLSETVYLMQYTGIQYTSDTRYILSKIGAGQTGNFETKPSILLKEDIRMLANYVTAEAVLSSEDLGCSRQEREFLAAEAVPVCVAAASAARGGASPSRTETLAQSILGKLCTKEGAAVIAGAAAIILAAKAVVLALELAAAGAAAAIGLKALWKHCQERRILLTESLRKHLMPWKAAKRAAEWEETPTVEEAKEYEWEMDEMV